MNVSLMNASKLGIQPRGGFDNPLQHPSMRCLSLGYPSDIGLTRGCMMGVGSRVNFWTRVALPMDEFAELEKELLETENSPDNLLQIGRAHV